MGSATTTDRESLVDCKPRNHNRHLSKKKKKKRAQCYTEKKCNASGQFLWRLLSSPSSFRLPSVFPPGLLPLLAGREGCRSDMAHVLVVDVQGWHWEGELQKIFQKTQLLDDLKNVWSNAHHRTYQGSKNKQSQRDIKTGGDGVCVAYLEGATPWSAQRCHSQGQSYLEGWPAIIRQCRRPLLSLSASIAHRPKLLSWG